MSTSIGFDVVAHDRASRTLSGIGRSVDTNSGKWRKLGGAIKWAGRAAGVGLFLAAGAAVKFASAAAEDEQSAMLLASALKNAAGATDQHVAKVEDWITALSLATGVSDDDLRPAMSRLVTATRDVTDAQALMRLSLDVAAGSGKSLTQVTEAMQKAQNGQLGGLSRLGVKIKDAAGETKSFKDIQQELATLHQGKAKTAAESTAGQYARLKVMASETAESLGYKLLPYAIRVGEWMLNTGVPAAEKLGRWLGDKLGPAVGKVIGWFKRGTAEGGDLSGVMDDLGGAVDDGKRAWEAMSPFIKKAASIYFPALWDATKLVIKGLTKMGDVGIWLWNNVFSTVTKMILQSFTFVSRQIGETLKIIGQAPGMGWVGRLGEKLVNASNKAEDLANEIRDIPDEKYTDIYVTTHHKRTGTMGGQGDDSDPINPRQLGGRSKKNPNVTHIGQQGAALMASLVKGIKNGQKPLDQVLNAVTANLNRKVDKWKGLLSAKSDFAESFKGWAKNLFSAEGGTDAEGNQMPLTMADILAQSRGERAKADSVNKDVATLIGLGMSTDLIAQMQAQGESGIEALHVLAGASKEEIAELNANQAATMKAYGEAGMDAASKVYDAQIKAAEADKVLAASLVEAVSAFKNLENVKFIVKGDDLVAVIKKRDKDRGK